MSSSAGSCARRRLVAGVALSAWGAVVAVGLMVVVPASGATDGEGARAGSFTGMSLSQESNAVADTLDTAPTVVVSLPPATKPSAPRITVTVTALPAPPRSEPVATVTETARPPTVTTTARPPTVTTTARPPTPIVTVTETARAPRARATRPLPLLGRGGPPTSTERLARKRGGQRTVETGIVVPTSSSGGSGPLMPALAGAGVALLAVCGVLAACRAVLYLR